MDNRTKMNNMTYTDNRVIIEIRANRDIRVKMDNRAKIWLIQISRTNMYTNKANRAKIDNMANMDYLA